MPARLELEDIQGTVLRNRPMPYWGAYILFRIDDAGEARTLIRRLLPHVTSAADWDHPKENAWINVVFSCEGLRRLGFSEEMLAGFPRVFRQGMASRSTFLGDVGVNAPENWDLPHGGSGLHAGIFVMAGSEALCDEKVAIGHSALEDLAGVKVICRLNIGLPPTRREHFGFHDGISRPFIEGAGGEPLPGQGEPVKAGEFLLGYENERGRIATASGPPQLWRNGTFLSIRKLRQKVFEFREFLKKNGDTEFGQELLAAKMMGRWRSGCPLAISPDRDDAELALDSQRNNAFRFFDEDPDGRRTPKGCHIRRVNPRDALKDSLTNTRSHILLRRGAAYGPLLPEDATEDDGVDRGLMLVFINADPERQFEFVQSQWVNDGDFASLGDNADPIAGRKDRANDFTYPARPARRHVVGLPDFALVRGGEHVFLPGIGGLKWLAEFTPSLNSGAFAQ